jgi:hypothetical protein
MKLDSLRSSADVYSGALQGEKDLADTSAQTQMQAASGMQGNEARAQEMRQRGMTFGTEGLGKRAEGDRGYERGVLESDRNFDLSNRSLAASAGAAGAANDRWQQEFDFRKQQAGLEGLGSLYGSDPTEYSGNKQFDLANRGQGSAGVVSAADARLKANPAFDWSKVAAAGAGIAGGMLTGGIGPAIGAASSLATQGSRGRPAM